MSLDRAVLSLQRLPARLDVQQTAALLGFQEHDIPLLTKAGLLKPLGKPAVNAVRYFSAVIVEQLARDSEWLAKATNTVYRHWQKKREREARTDTPMAIHLGVGGHDCKVSILQPLQPCNQL